VRVGVRDDDESAHAISRVLERIAIVRAEKEEGPERRSGARSSRRRYDAGTPGADARHVAELRGHAFEQRRAERGAFAPASLGEAA
jgi:hypothetical protein